MFCRHWQFHSGSCHSRPRHVFFSAYPIYPLFISHGSVFLSCLLMAVIGTYRMGQRSLWVTVLLVNVYGVCIYLIDRWLGANYMYLTKNRAGPLSWMFSGHGRGISSRLKPSRLPAFSFFIGFIASSKMTPFCCMTHSVLKMSKNVFIF